MNEDEKPPEEETESSIEEFMAMIARHNRAFTEAHRTAVQDYEHPHDIYDATARRMRVLKELEEQGKEPE